MTYSNESWYGVETYYSGNVITDNTTENVNPSPDIYYILNFNDICSSYGELDNFHYIMS